MSAQVQLCRVFLCSCEYWNTAHTCGTVALQPALFDVRMQTFPAHLFCAMPLRNFLSCFWSVQLIQNYRTGCRRHRGLRASPCARSSDASLYVSVIISSSFPGGSAPPQFLSLLFFAGALQHCANVVSACVLRLTSSWIVPWLVTQSNVPVGWVQSCRVFSDRFPVNAFQYSLLSACCIQSGS